MNKPDEKWVEEFDRLWIDYEGVKEPISLNDEDEAVIKAFIHKTRQEAWEEGRKAGLTENFIAEQEAYDNGFKDGLASLKEQGGGEG